MQCRLFIHKVNGEVNSNLFLGCAENSSPSTTTKSLSNPIYSLQALTAS